MSEANARNRVALKATWEIEALSELIRSGLPQLSDGEHIAIKGLAIRIHQLNSVIMSALGDMGESVDELLDRAGYTKD